MGIYYVVFISSLDLCGFFLYRSLDICIDNEIERLHAMRLIRKIMLVSPDLFPSSLLNVLISIANDGAHERDKMLRTCLATLCELGEIVSTFTYDFFHKVNKKI